MYKLVVYVAVGLLALCMLCVPVYSGEISDIYQAEDIIRDALPDSTREIMDDLSLELTDTGFGIHGLWDTVKELFGTAYIAPMRMLGIVIIISTAMAGLNILLSGQLGSSIVPVVTVSATAIFMEPVLDSIRQVLSSVDIYSGFAGVFLPLFAGILTVAGQPAAASAYNIFLFSICQGYSYIIAQLFVPLLLCFFGISIASIVFPQFILSSLVKGIKSFMLWSMGLSLVVLVGIISIQTAVASVGDSVSLRTTKFLLGSIIPIAGSAISDLYAAASGFIHIAKGFTGVYGILATAMLFLPAVASMAMWYVAMQLGAFVANSLGSTELGSICGSVGTVFGFLICILLYVAVIVIVATVMLLVIFRGAAV